MGRISEQLPQVRSFGCLASCHFFDLSALILALSVAFRLLLEPVAVLAGPSLLLPGPRHLFRSEVRRCGCCEVRDPICSFDGLTHRNASSYYDVYDLAYCPGNILSTT
jgi:hypothetical protein